jgi:hypothetical protein
MVDLIGDNGYHNLDLEDLGFVAQSNFNVFLLFLVLSFQTLLNV